MRNYIRRLKKKKYMSDVLRSEEEFKMNRETLKYVFQEQKGSDKLVVVFSGFSPQGKPPVYNYIWSLKDVDANKLYILDDAGYNSRGTYYLGKNRDFSIANAVTELIGEIQKRNSISNQKVITMGSSKGGFASLYFAFKNRYGMAITGGPQILLGDFFSRGNREPFMEYVSGGTSKEDVEYLDNLLLNVVDSTKTSPVLNIQIGKGVEKDVEHINALVEKLEEKDYAYILEFADYDSHGAIGNYFPEFAIDKINAV